MNKRSRYLVLLTVVVGAQDPAEHHDLAKEQPDLMANITARWQAAQARAPYLQTDVRTHRGL